LFANYGIFNPFFAKYFIFKNISEAILQILRFFAFFVAKERSKRSGFLPKNQNFVQKFHVNYYFHFALFFFPKRYVKLNPK